MATRDDNIVAEEARAIEVGEETGAGAPGASCSSGGSGRGRRDTWATHTGFILACVGSAVGMACNVALFLIKLVIGTLSGSVAITTLDWLSSMLSRSSRSPSLAVACTT